MSNIQVALQDLVAHGVAFNISTPGEEPLLHFVATNACRRSDAHFPPTESLNDSLALILAHKADVNLASSKTGTTLLMSAVFSGEFPGDNCMSVVGKLIDAGVDIQARDFDGWNVIDYAMLYKATDWKDNHPVGSPYCTNNPEWSMQWQSGRNWDHFNKPKLALLEFLKAHHAPAPHLAPRLTRLPCKSFL